MATQAEIAAHIDLTDRRIRQLLDEGVIERQERDGYDIDAVRVQYIRHLREAAAGRSIQGDLDPGQERARKDKELADNTALKNAVLRKELLPRGEVHVAVQSAFARVRAKLLALPVKLAPVLLGVPSTSVIREKVSNGINEALSELASTVIGGVPASDGQFADDGRGTGLVGGAGAAAESDGEPMGRP